MKKKRAEKEIGRKKERERNVKMETKGEISAGAEGGRGESWAERPEGRGWRGREEEKRASEHNWPRG